MHTFGITRTTSKRSAVYVCTQNNRLFSADRQIFYSDAAWKRRLKPKCYANRRYVNKTSKPGRPLFAHHSFMSALASTAFSTPSGSDGKKSIPVIRSTSSTVFT